MSSDNGKAWLVSFITAFATLFLQILAHRFVSAKLASNYAFLVISLTLLGFAVSGVFLSARLPQLLRHHQDARLLFACAFAITTPIAFCLFGHANVAAWPALQPRHAFVAQLLGWVPFSLLFAIPFFCTGSILGLLLAAPELSARRIYAFDLMGSAVGAWLVLPAVIYWGVENSVLAICALLPLAIWVLGSEFGKNTRAVVAATLLFLAVSAGLRSQVFYMSYPPGSLMYAAHQPVSAVKLEGVWWDPLCRIELCSTPPPDPFKLGCPFLVSDSANLLGRFLKVLSQNNDAWAIAPAYDGHVESLRGLETTLYAAAYQASSVAHPRVLVIGVGGGLDVLAALLFSASDVIGVEANRATYMLLEQKDKAYFAPWVSNPAVHLVLEEGRHYLAASSDRFDVIQLSGVDSYSGVPAAAAHVFTESYLYTQEAFNQYFSHLSDNGVLNLMRGELFPPQPMLRALATAIITLRSASVANPSQHILMLSDKNGKYTSLLMKRTAFSEAEGKKLAVWAASSKYFTLSAAPWLNARQENAYQAFLCLNDAAREASFLAQYPFDVAPIPDNRPFFFRYSTWSHLWSQSPLVRPSIPYMELTVLVLFCLIGLATLVSVYLPLRLLLAEQAPIPEAWRYAFYFASLGLGYFAIEIALLQKFGLLLGHPNYALSVVLPLLLVATGVGSLASRRLAPSAASLRMAAVTLALLVTTEAAVVLPLLPSMVGLPFSLRVATVCVLVFPLGVYLGVFLPYAIEQLKATFPAYIPWAWGINGIFSVLAPVLAVAVSMSWGTTQLLLCAVPLYLLAAFAYPRPTQL